MTKKYFEPVLKIFTCEYNMMDSLDGDNLGLLNENWFNNGGLIP